MKQTKLHDVLLFCFLTTVILLVSCQSKLEKTFPRLENITSSVYASNVSNEINSDNNFVGIIKASSTGKYMLTWNNGLIITTNNLI